MTGELWLGIDTGTQSVKASAVDDEGVVVAAASAPLSSTRDGVRHEQNPLDWSAAARTAVSDVVDALGAVGAARIRGIAVCATSGTITTVDALGAPTGPGLMYDDGRAGDIAVEVADADRERWARLGYRIQPSWALPKIVWWNRHGVRAHGDRFATQADVIAADLTGGPVASDSSHTLKSGYDPLAGEWPAGVLASLGVDRDALPDVVSPGTQLGSTSSSFFRRTGLPVGVPVYAGMTDGCAAQLGAGTIGLGDWHSVLGTTLVVKGVSARLVADPTGAVYSHRAPQGGTWLPGGASSVGAGAISTVIGRHDLAERTARVAERFDRHLDEIPLSYPLTGTGERFPIVRPEAVGFVRMPDASDTHASLHDAAAQLGADVAFAAIMLGVACVERLCVETMSAAGIPVDGVFSTSGGGAKNAWWTSLRADLLGREIVVPRSAEGSVGMAVLAAWAATGTDRDGSLPRIAARMSPAGRIVEPDGHRSRMANDVYHSFRSELQTMGWTA